MLNRRLGWRGLCTCCLALVAGSWACDGESGNEPAGTGASSGMPAGGATGGSAEPASGGGGGQDPACECDSLVCGATLTEPKIDVPPECGSIDTSRWLAGDNCELVALHVSLPDCSFTAYYDKQSGELAGTRSRCAGGPLCSTHESVPPKCPDTECVLCDPRDRSGLPTCEPL